MMLLIIGLLSLLASSVAGEIRIVSSTATTLEWNFATSMQLGKKYSIEVLLDTGTGRVSIIDEPLAPKVKTYKATGLKSNKVYILRLYIAGTADPDVFSKPTYTNLQCYSCNGARSATSCTKIVECPPNQRQCETTVKYFSDSRKRFEIYKGCKVLSGVCLQNPERLEIMREAESETEELTSAQALQIMPGLAYFGDLDTLFARSPAILKQVKKKWDESKKNKFEDTLKERCSHYNRNDEDDFCSCCCSKERCNHELLDCGITDPPEMHDPEPLPPDVATTKAETTRPTIPPQRPGRARSSICRGSNGGCDQKCTAIDKTTAKCGCFEGYTLQADEKTCKADYQHAVADIGPDVTIRLPQNSITISGTLTKGSVKSYKWWSPVAIGVGAGLSVSDPTQRDLYVTDLKAGTYRFILTVTGMDGRRTTDMMTLIVQPLITPTEVAKTGEEPETKTKKYIAEVFGQSKFSSVKERNEYKEYIRINGITTETPTTTPRIRTSTKAQEFKIIKQTFKPGVGKRTTGTPTKAPVRTTKAPVRTTKAPVKTKAPTTLPPKTPKTPTKPARTTRPVKKPVRGGKTPKTPPKKLPKKGKVGRPKSVPKRKVTPAKKVARPKAAVPKRPKPAAPKRKPAPKPKPKPRAGKAPPPKRRAKLRMVPAKPTRGVLTRTTAKKLPVPPKRQRPRAPVSPRRRPALPRRQVAPRRPVTTTKRATAATRRPTTTTAQTTTQATTTTTTTTQASTTTTPTPTSTKLSQTTTTSVSTSTEVAETCPVLSSLQQRTLTAKCTKANEIGSECNFECKDPKVLKGGSSPVKCGSFGGQPAWMSGVTPAVLPCCDLTCPANAYADVIFLIHSSSKIGKAGWTKLMTLTHSIMNLYPAGKENVCFGAMRYNRAPDLRSQIGLNCLRTKIQLKKMLLQMPYTGVGANTGKAMQQLLKSFKSLHNRPNAPDVAIILTDSKSDDDVIKPATALKLAGIKVHVVGVKTAAGSPSPVQMKTMATTARHVLNLIRVPVKATPVIDTQLRKSICPKACERYGDQEPEKVALPKMG